MNDTADFAGTAIRMDIGRSDAVITVLVANFSVAMLENDPADYSYILWWEVGGEVGAGRETESQTCGRT
jgi:hypothetical protein